MDNFLAERYAQMPEARLREVLLHPHEYRREALWTAEIELAKRGIPLSELQEMKEKGAEIAETATEKAELPLPEAWKWFYFFGALFIPTPFVWLYYRRHAEKGHYRRSSESLRWTFLGALFWITLFMVLRLWLRYYP